MHKKRRTFILIFTILALTSAGGCAVFRGMDAGNQNILQASGTVEAVEIMVSPELNGRVREVLVAEGDRVEAGEPLFRLEGDILAAQRVQAVAGLDTAEANLAVARAALVTIQTSLERARIQYDLEILAARTQEQPARRSAWNQDQPREFTLPAWYFDKSETIAAAQAELAEAEVQLQVEQQDLSDVLANTTNADFLAVEAQLSQAQAAFLVAQDVLQRAKAQSQELVDSAQNAYDAALAELEAAQEDYDQLISEDAAQDVLQARARYAVAEERYETALDRYHQLLTGEDAPNIQAAAAAVNQAEAQVTQAQEQIIQAEAAVKQAQAQIDLIDVQMTRLTVTAPASGVILARSIQPGEVVQPGTTALVIGQVAELTITVFIPEDRYGEIRLGDPAQVRTDSFPGQVFDAAVMRIADRAEFTPRNVQTEDGRRTTVFAIQLEVTDLNEQLKPGMPVDVSFGD
jgi:HlyD family secretion protein